MAIQKILIYDTNGDIAEYIPVDASSGIADAGKLIALGSDGRIHISMLPTGVGPDVKVMPAGETLSAGDLINVYDDSGVTKARKADASNLRRAHGFVLDAAASGANVAVYFEGIITGLSGMTAGQTRFLSTVGGTSSSAPTTSGYIAQGVGAAISATEISFEAQQPVKRA